ncbi:MAG: nucleotidyl transferase AbiEii/AbiGii toxin family protein [Bacteroidales bacterium]|jgi:predicted nucleotidyltransferase component of viral defense system
MLDLNKHKFFIVQILKDIYADIELANNLGFKGGTALMLFYDLPRFSVDIDFNLLDLSKSNLIYEKLRKILLKYGRIKKDEAKKHFGLIIVLDYGENERNLKVEIFNRQFDDKYEMKDFLGIKMKVMNQSDMFAHKLCALLDRNMLANRDIFDCWYFMQNRTPVNKKIVGFRTKTNLISYFNKCIKAIEKKKENNLLNGLGELMDENMKYFVRKKLKSEVIALLKIYKEFPIIEKERINFED